MPVEPFISVVVNEFSSNVFYNKPLGVTFTPSDNVTFHLKQRTEMTQPLYRADTGAVSR